MIIEFLDIWSYQIFVQLDYNYSDSISGDDYNRDATNTAATLLRLGSILYCIHRSWRHWFHDIMGCQSGKVSYFNIRFDMSCRSV